MEAKRQLVEIKIDNRLWLVDVEGYQIIDKENPMIKIAFSSMQYSDDGYSFLYSKKRQNIADAVVTLRSFEFPKLSENVIRVHLFHLSEMDPEGVAQMYGLSVSDVQGKSDYEIMTDKQDLLSRLRGLLPTVEIESHIFYVDFAMEMLRAKDNFLSFGIPFDALDDFYNEQTGNFEVTYNKRLQQLEYIDCSNLIEYPNDIIVVAIPPLIQLDPVGYARKKGQVLAEVLKNNTQKKHIKIATLNGNQSWLKEIIDDNRKRLGYPKIARTNRKGMRK